MARLSPKTFYPQEYYYLYSKYDARCSIKNFFTSQAVFVWLMYVNIWSERRRAAGM